MQGSLRALFILIAAAAIALGAQIDTPMYPAPMSLQSFAVVFAAALGGPIVGMLSVALYLAAGAAGLPVFAGGAAGAAHLFGPTAGYLWGFVLAAGAVGALSRRGGFPVVLAAALLGHAIILASGFARLAALMPAAQAFAAGVLPFVLGAVVKSAAAAALCAFIRTRTPSGLARTH